MRTFVFRATAMLTAVLLALGLTPSSAHAQRTEIGPITVCKVITFFDLVIFEYDCYTS